MRYLFLTPNLGLWYFEGSHFELLGYSDVDYARCKVDRKSISGTCQFLGRSLISWSSKKQNCVVVVHHYFGFDKLSRTMVTL
jgi:hypothetical protein